jgi:hypothetical protein
MITARSTSSLIIKAVKMETEKITSSINSVTPEKIMASKAKRNHTKTSMYKENSDLTTKAVLEEEEAKEEASEEEVKEEASVEEVKEEASVEEVKEEASEEEVREEASVEEVKEEASVEEENSIEEDLEEINNQSRLDQVKFLE